MIKYRRLRWARNVAKMQEGTSTFKTFADQCSGKRPLFRSRRVWENDIRMDPKYVLIRKIGLIGLRIVIFGEPI